MSMSGRDGLWRSRWTALGAAIAVAVGAGGMFVASADSGTATGASSFVPITPCRLMDTRGGSTVGTRAVPLAQQEAAVVDVTGTHGDCTIPSTAVAVSANVTVADGTAASFLTVWPSDAPRPNASTNNWVADQPPTPNKVDAKLSAEGRLAVFNSTGTVNVIIDIVGYYEPVAAAPVAAGVEYATGDDATLNEDTPTAVTSIVVSAPVAGFVLVTATAKLIVDGGVAVNCVINTSVEIGTMGMQDQSGSISVLTQSRGFEVPAGDTTFYQVCQQMNGGTNPVVQNNSLTALFTPNRL
jgi:hypothetical protein